MKIIPADLLCIMTSIITHYYKSMYKTPQVKKVLLDDK